MKLQHQNSYPQNYPPQNMGFYPNQQQNFYPQQQKPQGMFGNFIMDQLTNNMHGSGGSMGSNHNIPSNPYRKYW